MLDFGSPDPSSNLGSRDESVFEEGSSWWMAVLLAAFTVEDLTLLTEYGSWRGIVTLTQLAALLRWAGGREGEGGHA